MDSMIAATPEVFPELILALSVHASSRPAQPIVRPGDVVRRGQMIAVPSGVDAVPVYASAGGTIVEPRRSDGSVIRIVVAPDGFGATVRISAGEPADLEALVRACGILGHGGAGFPLHVKVGAAKRADSRTLVLNAVECEVPFDCDRTLLLNRPSDVLSGIDALRTYLGAVRCVVAVSSRTESAVRTALAGVPASLQPLEVTEVGDHFGAGDERMLLRTLFGRSVRKPPLPCDDGYLVVNPGTAAAVHRALVSAEPVLSRWVTLVGEGQKGRTLELPLGARVRDALRAAAIGLGPDMVVYSGGERMGVRVEPDDGVTAATGCLRVVKAPQPKIPPMPCIRCGDCDGACPYELPVHEMVRVALAKAPFALGGRSTPSAVRIWSECTLCGGCEPVCPSNIGLRALFAAAKHAVREQSDSRVRAEAASARFERHQQLGKRRAASPPVGAGTSGAIAAAVARSRQRREKA